jgi:hypothetical protein
MRNHRFQHLLLRFLRLLHSGEGKITDARESRTTISKKIDFSQKIEFQFFYWAYSSEINLIIINPLILF